MEIHGNATTFNLENVLRQNIVGSDYYRQTCTTLTNWSDIVDEIFESVDNVEPWLSGNARGASTAFCLLHRLCALKLTVKQVKDMLEHKDSPYIRAVRCFLPGQASWGRGAGGKPGCPVLSCSEQQGRARAEDLLSRLLGPDLWPDRGYRT